MAALVLVLEAAVHYGDFVEEIIELAVDNLAQGVDINPWNEIIFIIVIVDF